MITQFGHKSARKLRALDHQLIGIDAEIGNVASEGAQPNPGIGVKIALSQLAEPAERRKQLQAAFHRFTGQRVQDNVDTFRGYRRDFVDKRQRTGIEDVVSTHGTQEGLFFRRPGSHNCPGAHGFGHLKGSQPYRACPTMDEQPFAGSKPGKMVQRIVHGEKRNRQGCRCMDIHTGR